MTREQLDALENLLQHATTEAPEVLDAIRSSIAQARRALELEEALEWVATNCVGLWRGESGSVWAETGHGSYDGATALDAIQKARRGY